ncbi:MAG: hypothetical protein Q8L48_20280 [Archangium sp.]|nr:hypothetical protein [Archangium sp.]
MSKFRFLLAFSFAVILAFGSSRALAAGGINSVNISKIYVQPGGGVVVVWFTTTAGTNPDSCSNSGVVVLYGDYSSTAKAEGMRQTTSTLMSAYLAGKKIDVYSQGCVTYPWGGTAPGLYDVTIHN